MYWLLLFLLLLLLSQRDATDPCTTSGSALFRCSDARRSSHTPNWPVALILLLLHPPGILQPADIRLCEIILTFKRHLKTNLFKRTQSSCAASSASVSSDLKALYKSVVVVIIIIIIIIIIVTLDGWKVMKPWLPAHQAKVQIEKNWVNGVKLDFVPSNTYVVACML